MKTRVVQLQQAKQLPIAGPQGPMIMMGPRPGEDLNVEIAKNEADGYWVLPNMPDKVWQFNASVIFMYKDESS